MQELSRLWISLPMAGTTRGTDDNSARDRQEQVLKAYGAALDGYSIEAIANVVTALGRGEVDGQSTKWCPTPPELSTFVRSEQKRLDALNRKPAIAPRVISRPWIDYGETQRAKAEDLAADKGFVCIDTKVSIESFKMRADRKEFPPGTMWFWALQEVHGPDQSRRMQE